MSVRDRIVDTYILVANQRWEGALLSVLVAVAATAEKRYPKINGDRAKFERFFNDAYGPLIGITIPAVNLFMVAVGDESVPLQTVLYRWFRCKLIHEGKLHKDVAFEGDINDPGVGLKGGSSTDPMLLTRSHLRLFVQMVLQAPENAGEGFEQPK